MNVPQKRILLVEDNAQNRYLATFLLEKSGFHVSHAHNGSEGVVLALKLLPDLILMDIQMPEMDGYEAARRIQAEPSTRSIPIVAATSYAMSGDKTRALSIGFADYIEKPFEPEGFVARIVKNLPQTK